MSDNMKSVMPKKLAEALIAAGVQHFATGGEAFANPLGAQAEAGAGLIANPIKGVSKAFTFQNEYNANLAPTMNSDYSYMLGQSAQNALGGYGTSQDILSQQQSLANQLLAQSQGQGPNPANAMLAQQTGNNVAQQAALMASARGASANPAMIARMAAMQGGNIQQQGVGQAAIMNAQQQLQAQQQLAAQQQAMQQSNLGQQQLQGQLFTGAGALQNTQNANQIQNYAMMQGINSQIAQANANANNKTMGGLLGGAAKAMGLGFADGGQVANVQIPNLDPGSATGVSFSGGGSGGGMPSGGGSLMSGMDPGMSAPMNSGGTVPGEPQHGGNDKRNDVVPALLSKGEIVLPNTVTQSDDAPIKAAEFVKHLMDGKDPKSFDHVAKSKRSLEDRVAELERLYCGGKVGSKKK